MLIARYQNASQILKCYLDNKILTVLSGYLKVPECYPGIKVSFSEMLVVCIYMYAKVSCMMKCLPVAKMVPRYQNGG